MNMTFAQCKALAGELEAVSDSPRLDIELLLGHVTGKDRTWLFINATMALSDEQQQAFEPLFTRRKTGEPIAHILGQREFWSLPLFCDSSTLIPRPDTELLVEACLGLWPDDRSSKRVLDLGTGTGAITLALASEQPSWQLVGVDQSAAAIALAEKNLAALQLANPQLVNVQLRISDWFAQIPATETFDAIVSNPPYIDSLDPHLDQGDVRFEPRSALVADNHGLADLQTIITQAPAYLRTGGWLLLEHGYNQSAAVRELLVSHGYLHVQTFRDYGGNERVSIGQRGH